MTVLTGSFGSAQPVQAEGLNNLPLPASLGSVPLAL